MHTDYHLSGVYICVAWSNKVSTMLKVAELAPTLRYYKRLDCRKPHGQIAEVTSEKVRWTSRPSGI